MVLSYVSIVFHAAIVLISAVHNLKVNAQESNPRAAVSQIVQNISRVNNLLESFIKHVEQAEGTAEVSDQTAEAVSDVKDIFGEYHLRKHESNKSNDKVDNDAITLDFRASAKDFQVKTDAIETSRHDLSDIRYGRRENRRVNKDSDDDTKIVLTNLPNKNKTRTSLEANSDGNKGIAITDSPQKNKNKRLLSSEVNLHDEKEIVFPDLPKRSKNKSQIHLELKTDDEEEVVFTDSPKNKTSKTHATLDVHLPIRNVKVAHSTNTPKVLRQNTDQTQEYYKRASTSEEDTKIQEKLSQLKMLRQEIEGACRLVIKRKCYKALEKVLADVCRPSVRKCAKELKEDFEKNGKAACDKQFNKKRPMFCRMGYDYPELEGRADISKTNTDTKTQLRISKISKIENKCKKSNFKRAHKACEYAVKVTCHAHDCDGMGGAKRKAFNKACKQRCTESYNIDEGSDSSDSDSLSDSDDSVGWPESESDR